ncbi:F7-2 fimbrial protein, partial [Escherichia coli]
MCSVMKKRLLFMIKSVIAGAERLLFMIKSVIAGA